MAPRSSLGVATVVYLSMLCLLAATGIVASVYEITADRLFRDPAAVADLPFYTGAFTTVGLFLWGATAVLCIFTALVLSRAGSDEVVLVSTRGADTGRFLLSAGGFTVVLWSDEAFLFHEEVVPQQLGVGGEVVYASYGILAVAIAWRFREVLARSSYSLLLGAIFFLAASVGIDVLVDQDLVPFLRNADAANLEYYLEDGPKLLGVAGWLGYFGWTCYETLGRVIRGSDAWERSERAGRPKGLPLEPTSQVQTVRGRANERPSSFISS